MAGVVFAEVVLAWVLASGRLSSALWAFIAVCVLAVAYRYPMGTAVLALVLGVSVFYPERFSYAIGPLNLNGSELLLGVLLVIAVIKPGKNTWGGLTGLAVALFLIWLGVSIVLCVNAGSTELINAFNWSRVFAMYAFFFVVVRLFGDRESMRRLLAWSAVIAAVTGFIALLLSLNVGGAESFFQDPSQQFIHTEEGLGIIDRIRLPGLSLGYALFWYAVVMIIQTRGRKRVLWSIGLVGMAVDILVSFNRNMWIGVVIGLLAMLALSGPMVRRRLMGALAVLAFLIVVIGTQPGPESKLSPLVARGTSLTNSEELFASASLQSRADETEVAWNVVKANPLAGVGPGVEFGVSFFEATAPGVWTVVPQLFLHNQYIYLMLVGGVPLLLFFMVYLLTSLRFAWWRRFRTPESAAWGVGLLSIMLSSIVAIYFAAPDMVFSIALLTGAIYASAHGYWEQEEKDSR
ncbi:MAG TPA: O-antigen ligase family protein [Solirubrobacterales bacterium]